MAMFESFDGMECLLEEHPLAEKVLNLATLSNVDALILSDMPGGDPWSGPDHQVDPSPALHHATAAWTTGPDWAEALGGALFRFPATPRGKAVMDGGTRAELDMTITATDPNPAHPHFKGLPRCSLCRTRPI